MGTIYVLQDNFSKEILVATENYDYCQEILSTLQNKYFYFDHIYNPYSIKEVCLIKSYKEVKEWR